MDHTRDAQLAHLLEIAPPSFYARYADDVCRLTPRGGSFLDAGCGTGRVLRMVAERRPDLRLSGVDTSVALLGMAREKLPAIAHRLKAVGPRDIADGPHDTIGAMTVLEHVVAPEPFLASYWMMVKPGGHLIIAAPNFLSPWNHARQRSMTSKLLCLWRYWRGGFLETMPDISRPERLVPDDDATNVTHAWPIIGLMRSLGARVVVDRGTMGGGGPVVELVGRLPLVRRILPSCYVVFHKPSRPGLPAVPAGAMVTA